MVVFGILAAMFGMLFFGALFTSEPTQMEG
jgi:hypothetical protein